MVDLRTRRSTPELVFPARPTPHETKTLSDLDDPTIHRMYIPIVSFFQPMVNHTPEDPAKAIKAALAKALVYYYPVAGRLREAPGDKLVVECNEEGVVFVEADTDAQLKDYGQPILPPYRGAGELLCLPDGYTQVVGSPLVYMQVTRLQCGAFVIGLQMCHNIADGIGVYQFFKGIIELAGGKPRPTLLPVWAREIFKARTPPRVRHDLYPSYEPSLPGSRVSDVMLATPPENMVSRLFEFDTEDIAALRRNLPLHLAKSCTTFELLTAFLWRCRTKALGYDGSQHVRVIFRMNLRGKCNLNPPIPDGYYGNAVLCPMVETTVDDLCGNHLGYALELVRSAKLCTTEDHVRSSVDIYASVRSDTEESLALDRAFHVSNLTRVGEGVFDDLGWAKWTGGGAAMTGLVSSQIAGKKEDGEQTVMVTMLLPRLAMEKLEEEISMWIRKSGHEFIRSSM